MSISATCGNCTSLLYSDPNLKCDDNVSYCWYKVERKYLISKNDVLHRLPLWTDTISMYMMLGHTPVMCAAFTFQAVTVGTRAEHLSHTLVSQ